MAPSRMSAKALAAAALLGSAAWLSGPAFVTPSSRAASPNWGSTAQALGQGSRLLQIQRHADGSGLEKRGPLHAYTAALQEAAKKKSETVQVAADALMLKSKLSTDEFKDQMLMVQNDWNLNDVQRAEQYVELLKPFKSTVMPKFIPFLAKRRRLNTLRPLIKTFTDTIFKDQGIVPVKVTSARAMTDAEQGQLKDRMKKETGAQDIKLVTSVNEALISGFILEWEYSDPEALEAPNMVRDLSLRTHLQKSAMGMGVEV